MAFRSRSSSRLRRLVALQPLPVLLGVRILLQVQTRYTYTSSLSCRTCPAMPAHHFAPSSCTAPALLSAPGTAASLDVGDRVVRRSDGCSGVILAVEADEDFNYDEFYTVKWDEPAATASGTSPRVFALHLLAPEVEEPAPAAATTPAATAKRGPSEPAAPKAKRGRQQDDSGVLLLSSREMAAAVECFPGLGPRPANTTDHEESVRIVECVEKLCTELRDGAEGSNDTHEHGSKYCNHVEMEALWEQMLQIAPEYMRGFIKEDGELWERIVKSDLDGIGWVVAVLKAYQREGALGCGFIAGLSRLTPFAESRERLGRKEAFAALRRSSARFAAWRDVAIERALLWGACLHREWPVELVNLIVSIAGCYFGAKLALGAAVCGYPTQQQLRGAGWCYHQAETERVQVGGALFRADDDQLCLELKDGWSVALVVKDYDYLDKTLKFNTRDEVGRNS